MLPEIEQLATVVVCDDDAPTRELLCDHLTADRYRALPAPSASDALRLCGYSHPDLMVLDLGLPDAGGIDVLREIRLSDGDSGRFDPALPVIVLTGRSSEADRLRGFNEGADDYLVKPFHYPELVARMAAVLRRRDGRREGPLRVGELVIDPVTRRVRVGDRDVALANKEFALLRALASEPTQGLHQGRAAARRVGLQVQGPHPDPRLAREPPAAKARPRGFALRLQLLGRGLPAGGRLTVAVALA